MPARRAEGRTLGHAQTLVALAAALLAAGVQAQAQRAEPGVPKREIAIEPSLSGSLMYSDNHDQRAVAPESDWITRLSAGVSLRADAGRVRGNLDYTLTGVSYARHSSRNSLQNALIARGTADLLDDRLQLLGDASINRSAISAFGVQAGAGGDANSNLTEVRTLRLAPRLRGAMGPGLRYTAQLGYTVNDASGSGVGDSNITSASLRLEPSERAVLGWQAEASHVSSDYKTSRTYRTDRLDGTALWLLGEYDLQLSATAGFERTNVTSLTAESGTTWGMGLVWQPSPRTRLALQRDARVAGTTYAMSFDYRMPRTVFSWVKSRSLSTDASPVSSALVTLINADPLLRAAVQKILFPTSDPSQSVNLDFLRSAATSQDQHQVSVVWTGQRQTVLFSWRNGSTNRIDPLSTLFGDLAATDRVRQGGVSLNITHRLTPDTNVGLQLLNNRSRGDLATQRSDQRSAELQYSTRLTKDSTLLLSARRALMANGLQSTFDENSVAANFGVRF